MKGFHRLRHLGIAVRRPFTWGKVKGLPYDRFGRFNTPGRAALFISELRSECRVESRCWRENRLRQPFDKLRVALLRLTIHKTSVKWRMTEDGSMTIAAEPGMRALVG